MAQDKGMDLVELSPNARPPVAKLMDYSKFLFDEKKREKDQLRTQRLAQSDTKEVQLSPVIQINDLEVKIKAIKRILDEGDKVRITIRFKGRQLQHIDLGKPIFEKIVNDLPDAVIEKPPVFEGKQLFMILTKNK